METQTNLSEYESKQVGLNTTAYSILRKVKNKLITDHKKNFTFSDAIIEMDKIIRGEDTIKFTKNEIKQIKQKIKAIQEVKK